MKVFKKIILTITFLLIIIISTAIIIDPFFHFHKPLSFVNYFMDSNQQRYMNNGIIKNFDYDAIITGTSMTENFKTSQFDKLFDTNSIKIPFSGGSFKEINDNIEIALRKNKNIKYILRSLDYNYINIDSDDMRYNSYPKYLYDDNIFNDYKYILNRAVFFQCLLSIVNPKSFDKNIDFDSYSSWKVYEKGKDIILRNYKRPKKENVKQSLSKGDLEIIDENIEKNVTRLAKIYPNVKFIYFITPYSIIYWDERNQKQEIEKQILIEKYMIEKILEVPNIELYSFFNNYEMITNLDNYKDIGHYTGDINDQILIWIKEQKFKITKENYQKYIEDNLNFYSSYNYDNFF